MKRMEEVKKEKIQNGQYTLSLPLFENMNFEKRIDSLR